MKLSTRGSLVLSSLLVVGLACALPQARGQATASKAATESRFQIPETDDGLPGAGPIRRADWFKKLWAERRAGFAACSPIATLLGCSSSAAMMRWIGRLPK